MKNGTYKLYGRLSAGSLAPQMLLEEVGAPYELIWVKKTPTELEAFRRVSPVGKVPVLIMPDGTVVTESAAILIHLTNTHPAAGLAPPGGTPAHAHFLQWMVFLSANMYEAALRFYYAERYSADGAAAAGQIKVQALTDWTRHLEVIQGVLSPYVLGKTLSAADMYLYMLFSWYQQDTTAPASKLLQLLEHSELLRHRPATQAAEKSHSAS